MSPQEASYLAPGSATEIDFRNESSAKSHSGQ